MDAGLQEENRYSNTLVVAVRTQIVNVGQRTTKLWPEPRDPLTSSEFFGLWNERLWTQTSTPLCKYGSCYTRKCHKCTMRQCLHLHHLLQYLYVGCRLVDWPVGRQLDRLVGRQIGRSEVSRYGRKSRRYIPAVYVGLCFGGAGRS